MTPVRHITENDRPEVDRVPQ